MSVQMSNNGTHVRKKRQNPTFEVNSGTDVRKRRQAGIECVIRGEKRVSEVKPTLESVKSAV
jgi:hypothetical protein